MPLKCLKVGRSTCAKARKQESVDKLAHWEGHLGVASSRWKVQADVCGIAVSWMQL